MSTYVYVDGFNLYYRALKGTPHRWLDLEALCRRLLPSDNIACIRYFTARVTARPGDLKAPVRQDAYLRALRTLPCVTIHEGLFLTNTVFAPLVHPPPGGPKFVKVFKTEEKGSDVNLATYLLLDGFEKRYSTTVVISNDSDLSEPIKVVQSRLGKTVGVVIPDRKTKRSVLPATFYRRIRAGDLAASQFPAAIRDSHGTVRKPATW